MDSQQTGSGELNSYFRELAETSKPAISSSSLPSELHRACGSWVSVTAATAKAAFALTGVKAAGPIVDLVLALSGVGDAQTELLKSIKADTLLLRQEPLQTAVTLMAEAKRVGPSDERWAQFLGQAIESLYRAKSLAASSEEQAVVQFGLACAYLTLNKVADARHWIEQAVESEKTVLHALVAKCHVDEPLWRPTSTFTRGLDMVIGSTETFGFGLKMYEKFIKPRTQRDQIEAFRHFLQFANAAEICAAAICGRTGTSIMELEKEGTRYYLSRESLTLPYQQSSAT